MKYILNVQYKRNENGTFYAWLEDAPHVVSTQLDLKDAVNNIKTRYILELESQLSALKTNNVKLITQDLTEAFKEIEDEKKEVQQDKESLSTEPSKEDTAAIRGTS